MSVRLALAIVVALAAVHTVIVLRRTSGAPILAWWARALVAYGASTVLFMGNGSALQAITVPLANTAGVLGGVLVLRAARSVRGATLSRWVTVPAVLGALATGGLGDPAHETWAGGAYFLAAMGATVGAASAEMWRMWRLGDDAAAGSGASARGALLTFAAAATVYALFYGVRLVAFVTEGPDSDLFQTVGGTGQTTLVLIATVTAVTLAAAHLAEASQREDLHRRATTDDLTGVLGRAELLARAEVIVADRAASGRCAVVVSDLDFFKRVNDTHGHAEGDRALVAFARAWQAELGAADVVGRLGGDEFVAVLVGATADEAAARADAVTRRFVAAPELEVAHGGGSGAESPTASHGVAAAEPGVGFADLLARADAALYEAKAAGRNTVRVHRGAPEPAA